MPENPVAPRIPFVNERVGDRDYKYYIFDWDDNVLRMPTRIHLEKRLPDGSWTPHLVSTAVFSVIRNDHATYRPPDNDWTQAFVEFQDAQDGGTRFLRDTAAALDRLLEGREPPAPSFAVFRQTLIEGRLFAIVTARGHETETLRRGVRMVIDRVLTPDEKQEMLSNLRGYRHCFDKMDIFGTDEEELARYLALNHYHAVTSPGFRQRMSREQPDAAAEVCKQFAIRDFVEHVIKILERTGADALRRPISVGFSDDDIGNVKAVEDYVRDVLARHFPAIKFCVYDTSDPQAGCRKIIVSGQLDLPL